MKKVLSAKFGIIFIELVVVACIFFTKVQSFLSLVLKHGSEQFSQYILECNGHLHRHFYCSFSGYDSSSVNIFSPRPSFRRPSPTSTYIIPSQRSYIAGGGPILLQLFHFDEDALSVDFVHLGSPLFDPIFAIDIRDRKSMHAEQ